ncbi:MAG: hypothetical protein JW940_16160 [Polyangiaceae bacterium]|nr:hypothetical protein [Polyangiaceae bacterium]
MPPRARAFVQRTGSALFASWVLCACGAALSSEAPPESPAAEAAPEPAAARPGAPDEATLPYAGSPGAGSLTEMDALEHDLLVSEQNLDAQLARKQRIALSEHSAPESTSGRFATPPPSAPTKPSPEPQARPRSGHKASRAPAATPAPTAEPEAGPESPYLVGSPCDIACRALASMRRSAERLCVLAGADHPRCQQASSRVHAAAQRVRQAGCMCVGHEP